MEPGHACYPMRWLLVAALTGCANANGCYDTCCFAPSCPGPGSDSGLRGPPARGLAGPAGSGGEEGTRGAAACPVGYTRKLQSCAIPCCVPDAGTNGTCCQLGRRPGPHPNGTLAVPTDVQLAWQDFEVGALNSFQMVTFWGGQLSADRPFNLSRAAEFTAQDLDTDQWAEAVVAMGGKYQVLNVKDESGFLLWPTQCKYSNGTVCASLPPSPLSHPKSFALSALTAASRSVRPVHRRLLIARGEERRPAAALHRLQQEARHPLRHLLLGLGEFLHEHHEQRRTSNLFPAFFLLCTVVAVSLASHATRGACTSGHVRLLRRHAADA